MKAPLIHIAILIAFLVNITGPMPSARAQEYSLPAPGVMVHLSPPLVPPILKGVKVHPDDPFHFDFILDRGEGELNNDQLRDESSQLIRYFLASLTIPEKDLWVNLSPYEKDRIIPQSFGLTEMGRDLLAEDYMLKQITASLIYPEDNTGQRFWRRIYEEAAKKYGTTDIPVNTFNKVWIVPERAVVYENAKAATAYVVESKLKVMLEQDYLALGKNQMPTRGHVPEGDVSPSPLPNDAGLNMKAPQVNNGATREDVNALGSQIVREVIIPELTKEVNENKNFAKLRQVYNSLILATWYKKKIKDSILSQVYADQNKVAGVNIDDPQEKEKIYQQYLQAFKRGVYNYIKEEQDPLTQEVIPRKYFSGGVDCSMFGAANDKALLIENNESSLPKGFNDRAMIVKAGLRFAKSAVKKALDTLEIKVVQVKQLPEYRRMKDNRNFKLLRTNADRVQAVVDNNLVDVQPTLDAINSRGLLRFVLDPNNNPSPFAAPLLMGQFMELYDRVIAALDAKGLKSFLSWFPAVSLTSFNRTLEEQEILIAKGFPAAPGDKSAHLRGLAMDFNFRDLFDADKYLDSLSDSDTPNMERLPLSFRDLSVEQVKMIKQKGLIKIVLRTFWEVALEMEKEGTAHYISENRISVFDTLLGILGLKWPSRPLLHFAALPPITFSWQHVMHSLDDVTLVKYSSSASFKEGEWRLDSSQPDMIADLKNVRDKLKEMNGQKVEIEVGISGYLTRYGQWAWYANSGQEHTIRRSAPEEMQNANTQLAVHIHSHPIPDADHPGWDLLPSSADLQLMSMHNKTQHLILVQDGLLWLENPDPALHLEDGTLAADFKQKDDGKNFYDVLYDQWLRREGNENLRDNIEAKKAFLDAIGLRRELVRWDDPNLPTKWQEMVDRSMLTRDNLNPGLTENQSTGEKKSDKLGGIDLTPANMNLLMQNNGGVIKFHLDPSQLTQFQNAPGFVPVIINIQPMTDLKIFLGLAENKTATQTANL
ncbi:MAG: hypothetical protein HQL14_06245 [Candidatus Omnitrophica bacterium]|nr:hypothetical protein [Candidatus Omnitrophota bacterium]